MCRLNRTQTSTRRLTDAPWAGTGVHDWGQLNHDHHGEIHAHFSKCASATCERRRYVTLKTFLATVRLYWKTFALVTVTALALGLAWLLLTPPQYVSTTQLLVSINGSTTAAAYQNDSVVSGRVNSYIALLTSDVVSQRVIDKLGLHMSAPELAAKISATGVPPNTSIIDVAVTDESPGQARQLADTVAKEFV